MCGIAGIYRWDTDGDDAPVVERMLERLARRGPDGHGMVRNGAVTLGHRRLAVLDLSPAASQPMVSPSGRWVITFNGEIYNYRDLQRELGLAPEALRSHSDTEVLLHAWERWGPGCLERLVGQWAFAIHDLETRTLWLARDRFGEKPLFFHRDSQALTFASSIAAVLAAPWVPRELDHESLFEYVSLRYVIAPRTVLREVYKLTAGHLMRVTDAGVETTAWWQPRFAAPKRRRRRDELLEEFDHLFSQACERCLVSDVPVAMFLSDGIDSNSIRAALVGRGHEIPAYMFAPTATANAAGDQRELHASGGTVTEVSMPAHERVRTMPAAFASLTEPVGDGASLAMWLLLRGTRAHATVFLCGHGGDEVLGGYRLSYDRFRLATLRRFAALPSAWTRKSVERYMNADESAADRVRRLRAVPHRFAPAVARHLIHVPLPATEVRQLFGGHAPFEYLASIDRLYADCDDHAGDVDRIQEVLMRTFLTENILSFADSVAMDFSAELRMPFLDRDFVDFALTLPDSMRVGRLPGRTRTKRVLRQWAAGRMSADIIARGKNGFPFGSLHHLMASDGKTLREYMLGSAALVRVLGGLERWLDRPSDAFRGPWEESTWALLALGLWCEEHGVR